MTHLVTEFRAGLMGPSHLAMLRRVEGLTVDVGDRLALAGGIMTGRLQTATPSATTLAPFNIPHGIAPTETYSGDMWTTSANLFLNIGGSVRSFYHTGNLAAISQAEAEAGTATTNRLWTALRVRQAIDKAAFQTNGTIVNGTDLDTMIAPGLWHQTQNAAASASPNYPVPLAGMLMVTANGQMVYQSYTVYNSGKVFTRAQYNTVWSPWVEHSIVGHTHTIADTTGLQTALDLLAPLASPALTGTPTAPTQAAGNNSTRLATTAFVTAAVAKFGTDLAIAGVTGLQAALDLKAPLANPVFTGTATMANGRVTAASYPTLSFRAATDNVLGDLIADHTTSSMRIRSYTLGSNSVYKDFFFMPSGQLSLPDAPTGGASATRKDYVDGEINKQLSLTGGTMTGNIQMSSGVYVSYAKNASSGAGTGSVALILNSAGNFDLWDSVNNRSVAYFSTSDRSLTVGGNISAYSDERLKSDIKRIEGGLDMVMKMTGVSFTMNGVRNVGVVAQDMQKVLPEVVHEGQDKQKTLSVSYGNVVGVLIEAIKDLKAEIEELKRKI